MTKGVDLPLPAYGASGPANTFMGGINTASVWLGKSYKQSMYPCFDPHTLDLSDQAMVIQLMTSESILLYCRPSQELAQLVLGSPPRGLSLRSI